MGALEVMEGYRWIIATLSADSVLTGYAPGGIWRAMAKPETVPPFVVVTYQAGTDVTTMNAFRLFVDVLFQVRVVAPASNTDAIISCASRMDDLLGTPPQSGATAGGNISSCYRQSPLEYDELVSGELWTNVGGVYRLLIQQRS